MLVHPSECNECHRLQKRTRKRLRLEFPQTVAVQSWCRICGQPVYLEVLTDYELAKTHFYALDDQPMVHKEVHAEVGGWGIHWRLDDVLAAIFPHHEEPCWPLPPWYEHSEANVEEITVFWNKEDAERCMKRDIDIGIRMLQAWINRHPRSREELKKISTEVWSTEELAAGFEVLGFKAPFAIVREKATGRRGSVLFQNLPRMYFGFDPDRVI